jgi:filamentous hemagglutinin
MYPQTTDEALRFGEAGRYKADAVAEVFGKETAVDAKYVDEWGSSIRNPDSAIGDKPFAVDEQQRMVAQAKRYDEFFDGGSIYHTNSPELASYYYRLFRVSGITKARFIITPVGR